MTPIGRDRRPPEERGPVNWGQSRPAARSPRPGAAADPGDGVVLDAQDAGSPRTASGGPDWGVGRGSAPRTPTPGERARSPWPVAVRRQTFAGIAFALVGLVLATWSAMGLATSARAGHPWVPPWLVVVLAGAGLVAAAGYLAWAGGTALHGEAHRWDARPIDEAAGLTARGGHRGEEAPWAVMGTSSVDPSMQAPAGVAGAVGGFMLASAVVCAVIALVLGPAWLIGTAGLALGGIVAVRLAGDWLGRP